MDNGALPSGDALPTRSKKKTFEDLIVNPYIILPSPEELEEAKNVESDIPIPSRVFCNFPIRIGKSTFAGAGRGTFALKDIKAGNLIYKIAQTTVTALEPEHVGFACDNCLAIQADEEADILPNVMRDVKISLCNRCKSVGYCSKECQIQAWNHHHKLECKRLTWLQVNHSDMTADLNHTFYMLVRLLFFYEKGTLSKEEFEAIDSLLGHAEAHDNMDNKPPEQKKVLEYYNMCCLLAKMTTGSSMAIKEVRELYFKIKNNSLNVDTGLLRPADSSFITGDQPAESLGATLDPFVSLINHSCFPNAIWIMSGKTLSIRSTVNIPAGAEITITYTPPSSFIARQGRLLTSYNFTCTCRICEAGLDHHRDLEFLKGKTLTPRMRTLRREAYDYNAKTTYGPHSLPEMKSLIVKLKAAGFPDYFLPLPECYMFVTALCLNPIVNNPGPVDTKTVLLCILKIETEICGDRMLSERTISLAEKIMRVKQQILASKKLIPEVFKGKVDKTMNTDFGDLDAHLLKALMESYWFDRVKTFWGMERFFGENSEVARFERLRLKNDLEEAGVELGDVLGGLEKVKMAKTVLAKFAEQPIVKG